MQLDENHTWRKNTELFLPGALDRIIHLGAMLGVEYSFVLNTMVPSDEALTALNLQVDDVLIDARSGYYDHLPLVVDFVLVDPK